MKNLYFLLCAPIAASLIQVGCIETYDDDCTVSDTCEPTGGNSSTGGMAAGGGDGDGDGDVTGGTSSGGGTQLICDPACSDDTPICDEAAKECVACLKDDECEDDTPYCDLGSHECVACLATDQCTSADASVCSAGACEKCSVDDDCTHIEGKKVCDEGACVECSAEADCDGNVCDPTSNTSTNVEAGKGTTCGECEYDAQCGPGRVSLKWHSATLTMELLVTSVYGKETRLTSGRQPEPVA